MREATATLVDRVATASEGFRGAVVAVSHDRAFSRRFDRFLYVGVDGAVHAIAGADTAIEVLADGTAVGRSGLVPNSVAAVGNQRQWSGACAQAVRGLLSRQGRRMAFTAVSGRCCASTFARSSWLATPTRHSQRWSCSRIWARG